MKQNDFLLIVVTSSLLVIVWIAFNLYHQISTSTIPESVSIQIAPISPDFDTKTTERLHKREQIAPVYELSGASNSALLSPQTVQFLPSPQATSIPQSENTVINKQPSP